MKNQGICIGENGDLLIRNGTLAIGNTLYQNQYLILGSQPGEWKEFPTLGAGIADLALDHDLSGWTAKIKSQLEKDEMKVKQVVFENGKLHIEATY